MEKEKKNKQPNKVVEGLKKVGEAFGKASRGFNKTKKELKNAKRNFGKKKYFYQYFDENTKEVLSDERFAKNEKILYDELLAEGIEPISVSVIKTENKFLDFLDDLKNYGSVKKIEIASFATSMSLLTRNNYDLQSALKETKESITNKAFKAKLEKLIERIATGGGGTGEAFLPSEYFKEFPELFDKNFIAILSSADKTGNYGQAFKDIAENLKMELRIAKLKRKAKSGPLSQIAIFVISVTILMLLVFPKLKGLFKGQDLPFITNLFIKTSDFFVSNFLFMIGFVVLFFFIIKQLLTSRKIKKVIDGILIKIPIIRDTVKNSNMFVFANTFQTLGSAGYASIESLKQTRNSITNEVYLEEVNKMISDYQISDSDTPISDIMRSNPNLWRTTTSNLMAVVGAGEKTMRIHEPLGQEKETFLQEYEESVKKTITLVNVIVKILITFLVLGLALSILQPLQNFDPSAKKNEISTTKK